jgi:hypothetical protein
MYDNFTAPQSFKYVVWGKWWVGIFLV